MKGCAPLLLLIALATACTTPTQRRAAENASIKKQAAQKIVEICALKGAERQDALEKLKKESGYELHCAND